MPRNAYAGGISIFTCYDAPHCAAEFRSGSDPGWFRRQLEAAGWEVIRTKRETIYRCPAHKRFGPPAADVAMSNLSKAKST